MPGDQRDSDTPRSERTLHRFVALTAGAGVLAGRCTPSDLAFVLFLGGLAYVTQLVGFALHWRRHSVAKDVSDLTPASAAR